MPLAPRPMFDHPALVMAVVLVGAFICAHEAWLAFKRIRNRKRN
jgi:hypothetical protein